MTPLSEHLKAATRHVHRRVEQTPFVQTFLRGALPAADYVRHLQALREVYREMELWAPRQPALRRFPWPALARASALESDLRSLGAGPALQPSPATESYVARLPRLRVEDPGGLAPHAYVRYLGDLSGGQILARVAQSKLGLHEDSCRFYRFPEETAALKARFREALDELSFPPDRIVGEALFAFELNESLFLEIHPRSETIATSATATATTTPAAMAPTRLG